MLRLSSRCLQKSIPSWEKAGRVRAQTFLRGLMQSGHPMQKMMRDELRREEASKVEQAAEAAPPSPVEPALESHAKQAEVEATKNCLPYGATPKKRFVSGRASGMAVWGTYERPVGSTEHQDPIAKSDSKPKLPYTLSAEHAIDKSAKQWPLHGTCGIVLDIDGVVHRTNHIIDGSDVAIRHLQDLKVPLCFLTNGGGTTEATKAAQLSNMIGATITPEQVVLSHSPMRYLAQVYPHQPVLVAGRPACAAVAKQYGMQGAISVDQFQHDHPELVPFKKFSRTPAKEGSVPMPHFAAVMVFNDSEDVLNDVQVILDVLTSPNGHIDGNVCSEQTLPLYIAADDLLWSTSAPLPRLAEGAFREMLSQTFRCVTGKELHVVQYGKPRHVAYRYAEHMLLQYSNTLGWDPSDMRTICMVGDNLETDILGANGAGGKWLSVNVLSGVGSAKASMRTTIPDDAEIGWLQSKVSSVPHYVAATLDHFVRELEHFGEKAITMNKKPFCGSPCPVDLRELYHFPPTSSS